MQKNDVKNSVYGKISFVLAAISILMIFVYFVAYSFTPNAEGLDPAIVIEQHGYLMLTAVLAVIGSPLATVVGFILGIIGVRNTESKKTLATIGLVLNSVILGIMVIFVTLGLSGAFD